MNYHTKLKHQMTTETNTCYFPITIFFFLYCLNIDGIFCLIVDFLFIEMLTIETPKYGFITSLGMAILQIV